MVHKERQIMDDWFASAFDESLLGAVSKQLEASPCQGNNLALPIFRVFFV